MINSGKLERLFKIFGALYLLFNLIIFVAIFSLTVFATTKLQQISTTFLYLSFPAAGLLSGYWIYTFKYGWARTLVIGISLFSSAVFLLVFIITGPKLDKLKAEKLKTTQTHEQNQLGVETDRMFIGVYGGDIDVIKNQLAKGVDVNAINEAKQTALHVTQNVEIARLLIEHGADIQARDDMGSTPIFNKEIEIARVLLDAGVSINFKNENGNTLLTRYTYAGYLEGIEFLVSRGADINACNADNNNALDIAKYFHPESDVLQYLQSLNIQNCPE